MKAIAPGKLILSGEHAVVYGQPALAMAINRFTHATIVPRHEKDIAFNLRGLRYHARLTHQALSHLRDRLSTQYKAFLQGQCSIRDVLKQPFELPQFALAQLLKHLKIDAHPGLQISIDSDIPIGSGMGSSAATIISILKALTQYFKLTLSTEKILQIALETEQLQHGHCSGLDLNVALQGGCLHFQAGNTTSRPLPAVPMTLVDSGTPQSNTGECVTCVAPHFKHSQIGDDFAAVTHSLDEALQQNNLRDVQLAIRENHRLLVMLGVVPERVQQLVAGIEACGGAAKVCGAGSVTGDAAGAILVVAPDELQPRLSELYQRFAFSASPLIPQAEGALVV